MYLSTAAAKAMRTMETSAMVNQKVRSYRVRSLCLRRLFLTMLSSSLLCKSGWSCPNIVESNSPFSPEDAINEG